MSQCSCPGCERERLGCGGYQPCSKGARTPPPTTEWVGSGGHQPRAHKRPAPPEGPGPRDVKVGAGMIHFSSVLQSTTFIAILGSFVMILLMAMDPADEARFIGCLMFICTGLICLTMERRGGSRNV